MTEGLADELEANLIRTDKPVTDTLAILLFDNGSLRPEPTLDLRRIAGELSHRLRRPVTATSLLHSDRVDPALIDAQPAVLLEDEICHRMADGTRRFLLIPFFIGPSLALSKYLPARLDAIGNQATGFSAVIADSLVRLMPEPDLRLAKPVAAQVIRTLDEQPEGVRPKVIMVDHGSPARPVADVRNAIARELARLLGDRVSGVQPASMERRPGPEYDFNEPLLAQALAPAGRPSEMIIVSLLFLSPGRHAGPDGDIARICRQARESNPTLKTRITGLPSGDGIIEILLDRIREAETRLE